jgi:hypothetical protein
MSKFTTSAIIASKTANKIYGGYVKIMSNEIVLRVGEAVVKGLVVGGIVAVEEYSGKDLEGKKAIAKFDEFMTIYMGGIRQVRDAEMPLQEIGVVNAKYVEKFSKL